MHRGTRKLVPLFYNTILQKCKGVSAESSLLELCRATQYFDDENQNAKMQKCKNAKCIVSY